ncbi:MAG: hypothetical protein ABI083_01220, partial [Lapillicoccus sp.]
NDVLLILAVSVLMVALTRVVTGDLTTRTAVVVAVSLAVALLAKGFALVLPPVILVAYVWAGTRDRPGWPDLWRRLRRPAAVVVVGAVVGGLWWLRNLVLYGAVQINGLGPDATATLFGPPDGRGTTSAFVPEFLRQVASRIWGGVGLPDEPLPGPVIVWGWLAVTTAGLVAALVLPSSRGMRPRLAILTLPAVLVMSVVGAGSLADYHQWSAYLHGAQGRYVYLAIVPFSAGVVLGWQRLLGPAVARSRGGGQRTLTRVVALVTAAALATNAAVWAMILTTWYARGPTLSWPPLSAGFRALLVWAPVPPPFVVALCAVGPVLCGVGAVVALARSGPARFSRAGGGPAEVTTAEVGPPPDPTRGPVTPTMEA